MSGRWRELAQERVRLLRLLPHAGPYRLGWLGGWQLAAAITPALTALSTGWLIREVTAVVLRQATWGALVPPLLVLIVLFMLAELSESAAEIASLSSARRIDQWMRREVRALAAAPRGIAHLETPAVQDDLALVSDLGGGQRRSAGTAAAGQVLLLFRFFGALISAAVLARFSVLLAILLLVVCLAVRARIRRQWLALAEVFGEQAPLERRTEYWAGLLGGPAAAKEIRQFGIGDWLVDRREGAARERLTRIWAARGSVMARQGVTVAAAFLCGLAVLLWPGVAAAQGRIRADELVTYMVAGWAVLAITAMGREPFDIEYGRVGVQAFDRLRGLGLDTGAASIPSEPAPGPASAPHVRFEGVTFAYPGVDRPTIRGLDLEIRPGEVLAIVGYNGAGKTTLIKLLAGLYQPVGGRITVDGADLRDLDIARWRSRMTAVFQDFVHYPATVRDNIVLSAPGSTGDGDGRAPNSAVDRAIRGAGAVDAIERLPDGLDTPLWRGTADGVDLSGGQWQKLAIARALYAVEQGRRLLVLDEPTAHLDVNAEAAFFDQVVDAAEGATVVLISHRLSTIRRADRIVLLSDGQVVEVGTHADLVAGGGEYATLFRLQAARFAQEEPVT